MNSLLAIQLSGWLLVALAGFECLPLLTALIFGESPIPFAISAAIPLCIGLPLGLGIRPHNLRVRPRDGFVIVSSAWLLVSVFGAIPYMTSGVLSPVDGFFEAVAGFTTTGSTVMTDIESLSKSLLLWRSLTQWLGGMGIVVFTVALIPILGIGGMQLFKAEVPGPVKEKISPRVTQTARQLWLIYLGLTVAQWLALHLAGMSSFDALCHSLTTLSTGGFSTRNASLGAYESPAIEWIVIVFMVLAGMNFVLHYRILTGRVREVWQDSELRYFLGVLVLGVTGVLLGLASHAVAETDAVPLRAVIFQVVSVVTTTGYATADFEVWPSLSLLVLLWLMILGAMAGSTSGGVKSLRVVLAMRAVRNSFATAAHRNAVRPSVHYAGRPVPSDVLTSVWIFLAVYFALMAFCAAVVAGAGYDLVTSFSAAATSVGNVGPGLGAIGPYDHFAHFPAVVKLVLCFGMLAGRLELFTLLVLLSPGFWRR